VSLYEYFKSQVEEVRSGSFHPHASGYSIMISDRAVNMCATSARCHSMVKVVMGHAGH
jgi:hypothetical protein